MLAGMMVQVQEIDVVTAEGTAEAAGTEIESALAAESVEPVQISEPQPVETDAQMPVPVQEAVQAAQPQDTAQARQAVSQEPVRQEKTVEDHTEQPQQVVQEAVKPEQPRQENQASRNRQETETDTLREGETTVKPEEQFAAQSAANSQFQARLSGDGAPAAEETAALKTSEADMPRDIAEALAVRMPSADGELTLELEPASLGKIIIKVAFEGGKAVMSLMTDNTRTLSILSQRAGEMAQILEEKTGQQTVIYTPQNQPSQEELPERGGEENRQRQRDAQEENRHDKESESFMQQLRLGLVG